MKNQTNSTTKICHLFQGIKVWVNRSILNWNCRMRLIPKGNSISYRPRIWWVRVRLGLQLIASLASRKAWPYPLRNRRSKIFWPHPEWNLLSNWKIRPKVAVANKPSLKKLKFKRNFGLLKLTMQAYSHFQWVLLIISENDLPRLNPS